MVVFRVLAILRPLDTVIVDVYTLQALLLSLFPKTILLTEMNIQSPNSRIIPNTKQNLIFCIILKYIVVLVVAALPAFPLNGSLC